MSALSSKPCCAFKQLCRAASMTAVFLLLVPNFITNFIKKRTKKVRVGFGSEVFVQMCITFYFRSNRRKNLSAERLNIQRKPGESSLHPPNPTNADLSPSACFILSHSTIRSSWWNTPSLMFGSSTVQNSVICVCLKEVKTWHSHAIFLLQRRISSISK